MDPPLATGVARAAIRPAPTNGPPMGRRSSALLDSDQPHQTSDGRSCPTPVTTGGNRTIRGRDVCSRCRLQIWLFGFCDDGILEVAGGRRGIGVFGKGRARRRPLEWLNAV